MVREDCGNSPKNKFVEKFTIAFATGKAKLLLNHVTDDVCWNIVGDQIVQGKDDFAAAWKEMSSDQAVELRIHHIATHGKTGAVDGTLKLKSGRTRAFCDLYEFKGAQGKAVKEITSYLIRPLAKV
jgi:limonene-1,2-epoxide hydrolase